MYSKEMYLQQIEDVINRGPYKANWDSLSAHEPTINNPPPPQRPDSVARRARSPARLETLSGL